MIKTYLLALCSGSSVDKTTGNFTLFNLIENLNLSSDSLGKILPFEVQAHFVLDESAKNTDFEMRVLRIEKAGGVEVGDTLPFRSGEAGRLRLRVGAFKIPKA